jgi:hypothetical protein
VQIGLAVALLALPLDSPAQATPPRFQFRGYAFGDSLTAYPYPNTCTDANVAGVRICLQPAETIANHLLRITYGYRDGRLDQFALEFSGDAYDDLLAAFSSVWGKPVSHRTTDLADEDGAVRYAVVSTWRFREGEFLLVRTGDRGTAGLTTADGMRERKRRRVAAAKDEAMRDIVAPTRTP